MAHQSANDDSGNDLSNEKILKTGKYADFIIAVGGYDFKVHRGIICPRSSFLEQLCDSQFKEAQENHASLKEVDPVAFEKLLFYIYTGSYSDDYAVTIGKKSTPTSEESASVEDLPSRISSQLMLDNKPHNAYTAQEQSSCVLPTIETRVPYDFLHAPTFKLNCRIYLLADFSQIQGLKKEALKRCFSRTDDWLDPAVQKGGLVDTTMEVFRNTSSDDELRLAILRKGALVHYWKALMPELETIFVEEEPLAWILAKETYGKSIEIERLHEDVDDGKEQLVTEKDKMTQIQALLEKRDYCRNVSCDAEFYARVEFKGNGAPFLRCANCKCKHE